MTPGFLTNGWLDKDIIRWDTIFRAMSMVLLSGDEEQSPQGGLSMQVSTARSLCSLLIYLMPIANHLWQSWVYRIHLEFQNYVDNETRVINNLPSFKLCLEYIDETNAWINWILASTWKETKIYRLRTRIIQVTMNLYHLQIISKWPSSIQVPTVI